LTHERPGTPRPLEGRPAASGTEKDIAGDDGATAHGWAVDDVALMVDHATGTPEDNWEHWSALSRMPRPEWGPPGRVVVVAAHPDDHILGLGGILQQLHREGHRLEVVTVTDGETTVPEMPHLDPAEVAWRRRAEIAHALRRLDLPDLRVVRLGVPDAELADRAGEVAGGLARVVAGADWCISPWRGDGETDNEAVGAAAERAAAETGARHAAYPMWMWHWARPADERVPWHRARCADLDADATWRKRWAIRALRTQVTSLGDASPVLQPDVLRHFRRDYELVFVEPESPAVS
jgi:LmbE family N-acetylglucosaminyl deacetylase